MRWLMVVVGLVLAGLLTFKFVQPLSGETAKELPSLRVRRTTLTDSTVALGTVKSQVGAEVKVGSRVSGVVSKLYVNVGDVVKTGDLLASLNDADLRARVDVLRAQLQSVVAEREYAANELASTERLTGLVSQLDLDRLRRNLRMKDADVDRARASLADAQISLAYAVIRAPVAGTIASVSTYEGETIAASLAAPTFVTIVDLDRLEVQAFVDENDIGRVRVGQRVSLRVDAFPGRDLDGVVRSIYPKAQLVNNVVNYVVIIDIPDRRGLPLRPEMTVHASFVLEERANVIAIPRSAILRERGQDMVIVKSGADWTPRAVRIGLQTPRSVEVTSGLQDGDVIVADKQAWKDRNDSTE